MISFVRRDRLVQTGWVKRQALVVAILAVTVGCSSNASPVTAAGPTPPPPRDPTAHVGRAEFSHDESFCSPSHGRIDYVVRGGQATLRLHVRGLEAHSGLAVDWHNGHSARGYMIASFRTDRARTSRAGSLRMFRAGETRGSRLYLIDSREHDVAVLRPC
jgi:hypothetical protein